MSCLSRDRNRHTSWKTPSIPPPWNCLKQLCFVTARDALAHAHEALVSLPSLPLRSETVGPFFSELSSFLFFWIATAGWAGTAGTTCKSCSGETPSSSDNVATAGLTILVPWQLRRTKHQSNSTLPSGTINTTEMAKSRIRKSTAGK